ncbi:MAG: hypothetical protein PVF73_13355 [Bacteroidales bacterium]
METRYQIFVKEKLLVQKFTGVFSVEDYLEYMEFIMEFPVMRSINKVLIDFRSIYFEDMLEELDTTLERMTKIRKNINRKKVRRKNVKVVFWVDKPLSIVVAQLFSKKISNRNYTYCSTTEHVLEALGMAESDMDIEYVSKNLSDTFQ